MDLYKFLHSTTVQDLIRSNSKYDDLIYINTQTTVESCLEILVSKDILSVPVLDEKTRNFVGILDISQIMNFIVFASYEPGSIPTLDNMLKKTDLCQTAFSILNDTNLCTLDSTASFKQTLEWLAQGTHRLLVTNKNSTTIITQTDLIKFLDMHIDKFGDYKDKEIGMANSPQVRFLKRVNALKSDSSALRVFQIMHVNNVETIPIVDDKGVFITAISGSDLRGFTHDKLSTLFLPVLEFLKLQAGSRPSATCKSRDTIRQAVRLMVRDHVRHIWVVDDENKPKGVVSMTDIANYFYNNTLDVWYPADADN